MSSSNSYGWMPGWLKKFLNLDEELPNYGSGNYRAQADYAPPAQPAVRYTPPSNPSYTPPPSNPSYTPGPATYTPGPATYTPPDLPNSWQRSSEDAALGSYRMAAPPSEAAAQASAPPPLSSRVAGTPVNGDAGAGPGAVLADGTVSPAGPLAEGYVQPVGYGLRSYARGTLPPQGLEQFTREFRATLTDVWNFYGYWTRFQTDELVRIGREAVDTVVPPSTNGEGSGGTSVRRIKVAIGNGDKKPTPTDPPAPTAAPSASSAPSAPVTAKPIKVKPAAAVTPADAATAKPDEPKSAS